MRSQDTEAASGENALHDEQIENAEQAFREWTATWDLSEMSPKDVFIAGYMNALEDKS